MILAKEEGLPVYRVKREDGEGSERVIHKNNLLPVVRPLPVEETATPAAAV